MSTKKMNKNKNDKKIPENPKKINPKNSTTKIIEKKSEKI